MLTKRSVLLDICEHPGWEPPESACVERWVKELHNEGWIQPRLDGWEATPPALDTYPRFVAVADIADPTAVRVIENADGEMADAHVGHKCVPRNRVEVLLVGMLRQMPVGEVYALASAPPSVFPAGGPEWEAAAKIAERMAEWQP